MKELRFLHEEHPESIGRIDDKSGLTWDEIATLLKKYLRANESDDEETTFCTCGNTSEKGTIEMHDYEDLVYYCCDCRKQLKG